MGTWGGFAGADVGELRELAAAFDARANAMRGIESQLTWRIHGARWDGPDGARFVGEWNSRHRTVITAAGALFTGVAAGLRAHADQQDRASAADADGAGSLAPPVGGSAAGRDVPAEAARQWAALTQAQRDAYVHSAPEVVGNADGLPAQDRSAANIILLRQSKEEFGQRLSADQATLEDYLAGLRSWDSRLPRLGEVFNVEVGGFISPAESARLNHLHEAVAMDQKIIGNADAVTGKLDRAQELGTQGYLLIYRPEDFRGDGRAAIAFGNPDHAGNTAVIVPGLSSTIQTQYADNQDAEHLFHQMTTTSPGTPTSVIAYLGYDAPEMSASVLTQTRAEAGGALLLDDVAGWRAAHEGPPSHLTVIGHSYGSTTVADAVAQGLRADDYVLIGSPGLGHASPADFGGGAHLYTGSASMDPVADSGWFGTDPAFRGSDATRFHAESVNRGNEWLNPAEDHSRYFDVDTAGGGFRASESLANIATIANGQPLAPDDIARQKYYLPGVGLVDPESGHRPRWGANEGND